MNMKSLQVLFEMFMPEARFPDEKFWNKDGSAIHPDPKGPPAGTVGKTHVDIGAQDQDDQAPSKITYLSHDPQRNDIDYDVSHEDDTRDPWNGGFPGSINKLEDELGIDAHEVGFWLDTDGSLNCDYSGDDKPGRERHGGSLRWDGKTWDWTSGGDAP